MNHVTTYVYENNENIKLVVGGINNNIITAYIASRFGFRFSGFSVAYFIMFFVTST